MTLDEEIARRVELTLNAPAAHLLDALEAHLMKALDPAFTGAEVFGAVEGLDLTSGEAHSSYMLKSGEYWSREIHTDAHGIVLTDKVNKVPRQTFEACRQFKGIAQSVMWPDVFYMEAGRDMRELHKEDPKRHSIDWFRNVSLVPLPDLKLEQMNPYLDGWGTEMKWVAKETWNRLIDREVCSTLDITDEVIRNAGVNNTVDHRTAVQDTLRDLALFGLCTRAKDFNGTPVYIWGKPQYPD
jgi:hypothetical protein